MPQYKQPRIGPAAPPLELGSRQYGPALPAIDPSQITQGVMPMGPGAIAGLRGAMKPIETLGERAAEFAPVGVRGCLM